MRIQSFGDVLLGLSAVSLSVSCNTGISTDEQIHHLAAIMMRKALFAKVDRLFKKPKPGKKRLAKWPKKLVPQFNDQARHLLFSPSFQRASIRMRSSIKEV